MNLRNCIQHVNYKTGPTFSKIRNPSNADTNLVLSRAEYV